jgi:hypothetical protein
MIDWRLTIGATLAGAVLLLVLYGVALGVEPYAESEAGKAAENPR